MDKGSDAMAMAMDASWFESNHGLCNKGRNILKLTIEHDAPPNSLLDLTMSLNVKTIDG
jgi:hypothetical protein